MGLGCSVCGFAWLTARAWLVWCFGLACFRRLVAMGVLWLSGLGGCGGFAVGFVWILDLLRVCRCVLDCLVCLVTCVGFFYGLGELVAFWVLRGLGFVGVTVARAWCFVVQVLVLGVVWGLLAVVGLGCVGLFFGWVWRFSVFSGVGCSWGDLVPLVLAVINALFGLRVVGFGVRLIAA